MTASLIPTLPLSSLNSSAPSSDVDMDNDESRRMTFVQASGEGNILSAFMAQHSNVADQHNTSIPMDEEQQALAAKQAFNERCANNENAVPSTPAKSATDQSTKRRVTRASTVKNGGTRKEGQVTTTLASTSTAPLTARSATGRPPLHSRSNSVNGSMTARHTRSLSNNSAASKENKFSSTTASPSLKRKSMALTPSSSMNKLPPTGSSMKKARTSCAPALGRTSTPSSLNASGAATPRRSMTTRKSMQPSINASATLKDSRSTIAQSTAVHAQLESMRGWMATAQWRLVLLRAQRATLQSQVEQLQQTTQAHTALVEQLSELESEMETMKASNTNLSTQLQASRNSEEMLRVAAETLEKQLEELSDQIQNQKEMYCQQLEEARTEMEMKTAAFSAINQESMHQISTLHDTEKQLRAQLEATEKELAEVKEQRHVDEMHRKALHRQVQDLKGSIRVFCRIRPSSQQEMATDDSTPQFTKKLATTDLGSGNVISNFSEELAVVAPAGTKYDGSSMKGAQHSFIFDKVFMPSASQAEVYSELDELVVAAMDAPMHFAVFAYGATGSGKTHTMLGSGPAGSDGAGCIPRAIERIFSYASKAMEKGWQYTFKATLLEIYNDDIVDLNAKASGSTTNTGSKSASPRITHDKSGRVVLNGVEWSIVSSAEEVHALIDAASKLRAVGATNCNQRSSRSHTIFQLAIEGVHATSGEKISSLLSLIDLAGSERLDLSGAASNPTLLKETQHINASLSSLVTCMAGVASRQSHVSFRDCKLTHLLSNSLGARGSTGVHARTMFFINVAPESTSFAETMCTLRFADKLKKIEMNGSSSNAGSNNAAAATGSGEQTLRRSRRR